MQQKDNNSNNSFKQLMSLISAQIIAKVVVILIVVIALIIVIVKCKKAFSDSSIDLSTSSSITKNEKIDITPTQISAIENIGEWAFLEIDDEEMVDTTRHGFFSDDKLVRIYYGTLRLGCNMKEAHEGWLTMKDDTLHAILPPVRLLDNNFIDETCTRPFIETGKWTHADRQQMYNRAMQKMRQRCLNKTNYDAARNNAKAQFENLVHSMGFNNVAIKWAE